MWKQFKDFIAKGNVLDLAVAFVLGVAFAAVVKSFVDDIIMPPIGLLLGHMDFSNLFINLSGTHYASLAAAKAAGAPTINYGTFLNTIINFLIVGFALFLVVKQMSRFQKPAACTTKNCPYCYSCIPLEATRCPSCTSEQPSA